MRIYTRYSMSIIEKVFHYEENEISVIKCGDEIWFRGKDIAKALGYLNLSLSLECLTKGVMKRNPLNES